MLNLLWELYIFVPDDFYRLVHKRFTYPEYTILASLLRPLKLNLVIHEFEINPILKNIASSVKFFQL
jgi:hypothetical protein